MPSAAAPLQEPVAIVGIGCRLPGGVLGADSFWDLLTRGADAITEVPPDRWSIGRFWHPESGVPGKTYSRWGGFVEGIDEFEPECFRISPREAAFMDPQQRLLLEVAWEALEDAGIPTDRLAGSRTGVFVGISTWDYAQIQTSRASQRGLTAFSALGTNLSIAASRISYCLDLRGPSMSIDTACSSSLVAVDRALGSLRSGECEMAIAGGVNVLASPEAFIAFAAASMLSPDGRCKAFDAAANGYVRGEGAGVVLLKPLEKAKRDGDPVLALILGSGVNQDGRSSSISVPNRAAQRALLEEAYRAASVQAEAVAYVEAHGPGTPVGDPIEAAVLGEFFSAGVRRDAPLYVGSVKTNIGHLEAASGIAGLIKLALCVRHRAIPPNLHFNAPSPQIDFEALQLRVPTALVPWPDRRPVIGGVNSFGFGGTNAHVIVGEHVANGDARRGAPGGMKADALRREEGTVLTSPVHGAEVPASSAVGTELLASPPAGAEALASAAVGAEEGPASLLPLTARSDEALRSLAEAYDAFLSRSGDRTSRDSGRDGDHPSADPSRHGDRPRGDGEYGPGFDDICFSAGVRRRHYEHRLAVLASDRQAARRRLRAFLAGERPAGMSTGVKRSDAWRLAFVFSGQGTQWWRMGRELLAAEPIVRQVIERCDARMRQCGADWSLLEELHRDEGASRIDETAIAQPAIFALQAGLLELWRSWGIEPDAVVGHSVGEVAAAHAAGVYDLDEAARLALHRGRAMNLARPGGKMLAVRLTEQEALRLVGEHDGRLSLAAINGPTSVTISGRAEDVERLAARLQRQSTWFRALTVSHGFHSAEMEPAKEELLRALADLSPSQPGVPLVSTVTGGRFAGVMDAGYWWENVRGCVRFREAVRSLVGQSYDVFVEVGPHPALSPSILECAGERGLGVRVLPSLRRGEPERETMLASLGALFTLGREVDWEALCGGRGRHVTLPRHPWRRARYWSECSPADRLVPEPHPLLGYRVATADPCWQQDLDLRAFPYLRDHRVDGKVTLPAAAFVEMALAAACASTGTEACCLEQVQFHRLVLLAEESVTKVETRVDSGERRIEILGAAAEERHSEPGATDVAPRWTRHFSASWREVEAAVDERPPDVAEVGRRLDSEIPVADLYARFERAGLEFGPCFRGIREVRRSRREALGDVELPDPLTHRGESYRLHPALLDGCFQLLSAAVDAENLGKLYLPERIERIRYSRPLERRVLCHARLTRGNELLIEGDLKVYSRRGRLLVAIDGFRCRRVGRSASQESSGASSRHYVIRWKPQDLTARRGLEVSAAVPERLEVEIPERLDVECPERFEVERPERSENVSSAPGEESAVSVTSGAAAGASLSGQTWLLLADRSGVADEVAERLAACGARSFRVRAGDRFERRGDDELVVSPADREEIGSVIRECTESHARPLHGIVHLWGLDLQTDAMTSRAALEGAEEILCHGLMHVIQGLDERLHDQPVRLLIVTRGARVVDGERVAEPRTTTSADAAPEGDGEGRRRASIASAQRAEASGPDNRLPTPAFHQSSLLGLGRVVASELHRYRVTLLDIDPEEGPRGPAAAATTTHAPGSADNPLLNAPRASTGDFHSSQVESILAELLAETAEEEVAWRGGRRWVPRLEHADPETMLAGNGTMPPQDRLPFRLEAKRPGALDSLTWRQLAGRAPCAGEVQVAVRAAGLNFRDVLKALGLYPAEAPDELQLGDECAGTVVAVGEQVDEVGVGEDVVVVTPGCLGSVVTVPVERVLPLPAHLGPAEAVTMPIAFLTAGYALNHLAELTADDSILIHSAAGGVGLAAVQLARKAGAAIYATAGSEDKRRLLRAMGVARVMDSRSLAFADEVLDATGGRGVDVVLNSLAGQAMSKSLECLAPHGRFLELGKRDLYENRRIGLWPFRSNVSYFTIDLGAVLFDRPAAGNELLRELAEAMAEASIEPLPHDVYTASAVGEAFRRMSQGKHVGKIVIDMTEDEVVVEKAVAAAAFRADGTYLISGGFGGLGLSVARWIAERGGRHLVLLGRKGPTTERARDTLQELRALGARVAPLRCDVVDEDRLAAVLRDVATSMPPLRGIFHAAMVLDDGILLNLDAERFARVMRPKALGAWNLHRLTLDEELEEFVLFSSASASLGTPGQASYAAANAFLEGLAAYRRALGLPAKAVELGLVNEVGVAAGRGELLRLSARRGVLAMSPEECLEALGQAMGRDEIINVIGRFDWDRVSRAVSREKTREGLMSSLAPSALLSARGMDGDVIGALLAGDAAERQAKVEDYLCRQAASVLGTSAEKIGRDRPLTDLGFDSLLLVELTTVVERDLGPVLAAGSLAPDIAIRRLAGVLLGELERVAASRSEGPPSAPGGPGRGGASVCHLVPMRSSGDGAPLFLVHPLSVHEGVYRPLVEALAPRQPVYGLSAPLEKTFAAYPMAIDERVCGLVAALREVQPEGPYFLCGYSMGGHLAVKMARALEDAGQQVRFVGAIEWELDMATDPRTSQAQATNLFVSTYRLLEKRFGILAPISDERLAREAEEAARRMLAADEVGRSEIALDWLVEKRYVIKEISLDGLGGYLRQIYDNYLLLSLDTAPRPIAAPLHVWRARDGLGVGRRSWSEVASDLRSEEIVDGDHFSLMIPPQVDTLAALIDRHLDRYVPIAGASSTS